jgi:hypothetical protein
MKMQSAIVEEFDVVVDCRVGEGEGMKEGRRTEGEAGERRSSSERERPRSVNSRFFKLNFNLFSKYLRLSFVFPCLRIS